MGTLEMGNVCNFYTLWECEKDLQLELGNHPNFVVRTQKTSIEEVSLKPNHRGGVKITYSKDLYKKTTYS